MAKKYKEQSGEKKQTAKEPSVRYSVTPQGQFPSSGDNRSQEKSLSERKAAFVHMILNEMDEETFNELEAEWVLLYSKSKDLPCQYSVEELRQRVRESIKQIEKGEYVHHENLEKYIFG